MFSNKNIIYGAAAIAVVAIIGVSVWAYQTVTRTEPEKIVDEYQSESGNSSPSESSSQKVNTQAIDPDKLKNGCPRQDCIPSIDDPKFTSVSEGQKWLEEDDLIFGLERKGITRAYPQKILNHHEIVNDEFEEEPIAVTFCPLCGSAMAFERTVNGQPTEFGVSGKLYNNNLVMYDRQNENYWQQETGKAIVGEAAQRGERLEFIPMITTTWGDWQERFPESEVLSRETGHNRNYQRSPYTGYEDNGQLYFGLENERDKRLEAKKPGFGFSLEELDKHKFYTTEDLQQEKVIEDEIGGEQVKVKYNEGQVIMEKVESGEEIVPIRTFWFAFAAFHPETELYQGGE